MWVFTRAKRYNNKVREGRPIFFIRKFSKLRRLFCNFGHLDESSMSSKVDPTVFADNVKLQRGGIEENPDDVVSIESVPSLHAYLNHAKWFRFFKI